jgi:hypothetical protein
VGAYLAYDICIEVALDMFYMDSYPVHYGTPTVKRHFYAREKIMRIGQNGPLDKFTRFLFMRLNVPCIAMYGVIKIYARQIYATAA